MSSNSDHNPPPPQSYYARPVSLPLIIVLLVFFVGGFFSIYLCRCFMVYINNATWYLRHTPFSNAVRLPGSTANGLDPSIISTFPMFVYSSVKNLWQDKCGLECTVCLSEFKDDDVLRLLAVCSHVFHKECVDLWLRSHTTCSICRRSLASSKKSSEKSPEIAFMTAPEINQQENVSREDNCSIFIKEEEETVVAERGQSHEGASSNMRGQVGGDEEVERFSRSHSTGHSIIHIREEDDRVTLRLPSM